MGGVPAGADLPAARGRRHVRGAIAATLAAAAEHGRTAGGFRVLEGLPAWLTADAPNGRTNLFNLFVPAPSTRSLFELATAGLGRRGLGLVAVVPVALRHFWIGAFLGAAPGLVLLAATLAAGGRAAVFGAIAAALVLIVGIVVGVVGQVLVTVRDALPANGFGLCTGNSAGARATELTPWLHTWIQTAAGRTLRDPPLTFGDLWGPGDSRPESPLIDLAIMTTNLTEGRPERLPWDASEEPVYFDLDEMRRLLPHRVVRTMIDPSRRVPDPDGRVLYEMPPARDVPVLLATRMSLSFPILLSAVRLYRKVGERYLPLWYSDGGVCSNFPVHFFDSPLPSRPTFAMNLAQFPPERREAPRNDEPANIDPPVPNSETEEWRRRELATVGLGATAGFLGTIVDTARGWVDGSALTMPGYRDRIVTVYHTPEQGGMNLDMREEVIDRLTNRGLAAAEALIARFVGTTPIPHGATAWDEHRWVRFRTAAASLERWLRRFHDVYCADARPFEMAFPDLLGPDAHRDPPLFEWSPAQAAVARTRTDALIELGALWEEPGFDFASDEGPTPSPVLRSQRRL